MAGGLRAEKSSTRVGRGCRSLKWGVGLLHQGVPKTTHWGIYVSPMGQGYLFTDVSPPPIRVLGT